MKLVISYDLADKIKEAKTGFSLKRCCKRVLFYTGISMAIGIPINIVANAETSKYLSDIVAYLGCHSAMTCVNQIILKDLLKKYAENEIAALSSKLPQINVNASTKDLLEAYPYKTEYNFNYAGGGLEQKKYINVPVSDVWGEREMSVVQEHTLGSKEYVLSLGFPDEEKVYSLGTKRMINK